MDSDDSHREDGRHNPNTSNTENHNDNDEIAINHGTEAPPVIRISNRVRSKPYRFGQPAYD
jgi:hypothetical protein